MNREEKIPYQCYVLVCNFDRHGARKSCEDGNGSEIRQLLKDEVRHRGWNKVVRVSKTGCLNLCGKGPNVMIQPQNIWFSEVKEKDVKKILEEVEKIIK